MIWIWITVPCSAGRADNTNRWLIPSDQRIIPITIYSYHRLIIKCHVLTHRKGFFSQVSFFFFCKLSLVGFSFFPSFFRFILIRTFASVSEHLNPRVMSLSCTWKNTVLFWTFFLLRQQLFQFKTSDAHDQLYSFESRHFQSPLLPNQTSGYITLL